jgi:SAM-dependent methyltransferase
MDFSRRTATTIKVTEHCSGTGLTDRIKSALARFTPEDQTLTVAQLAPLDQFHTRGILATAELATAAGLETSTRVLDLGCGIGGPARYLAATFGCKVTGVDLSPSFIDAATYLTRRGGIAFCVCIEMPLLTLTKWQNSICLPLAICSSSCQTDALCLFAEETDPYCEKGSRTCRRKFATRELTLIHHRVGPCSSATVQVLALTG